MLKFNQDNDGEIDWDEFLDLMTEEMASNVTGEELIETFKTFGPKSEKDCITFEQLKTSLFADKEIIEDEEGLEKIRLLFEDVMQDKEKAGITFSDFVFLMMAK